MDKDYYQILLREIGNINNTCGQHLERKQAEFFRVLILLRATFIVDYNVPLRKMKITRTMLRIFSRCMTPIKRLKSALQDHRPFISIFETKKIVAYKHVLYKPLANGR
ncbi:hypothetical protein ACJIZ3_008970 [Penstemon smallii]|uniref:Uncharacterized protein n=1 Tax=Penstemon smallii TaxID=265156 RepID=A0ABD3TB84_9LAMI